jgi:hypothetical protein
MNIEQRQPDQGDQRVMERRQVDAYAVDLAGRSPAPRISRQRPSILEAFFRNLYPGVSS